MHKTVISFLKKNGFKRMEKNSYANDLCNVKYEDAGKYSCYAIVNNNGDTAYTNNISIYELIGYLTYHNFIDKNYKI
jgi:hypothetical protein